MNCVIDTHLLEIPQCGICGKNHIYLQCDFINIKQHIPDSIVPRRARLTLPECVKLQIMADGTSCATAVKSIEKGTQFGPLEAKKLFTLDPNIQLPLKLFSTNVEDLAECYLDTCDEENCNWMIFVHPAQTAEEQNIVCFQEKCAIYFVVCKNIQAGEHLKLWYSPHYAKQMGFKELSSESSHHNSQTIDINELLKKQQNIIDRENWTCKFCGKLETHVSSFASHMLNHYSKRGAKKTCELCKQTFNNKMHLRKHQKIVHKIGYNKDDKLKLVTFESKNKDTVGGPLLNNVSNDNFDNSNLMLSTLELNQYNIIVGNTMENHTLLENESLTLSEDNLLIDNVKELDNFNFEIMENQEQHICDICLKSFLKLNNLKVHMRKHTGQYICRHCLKIFSRSENLQAHVCNEFKVFKFNCTICQRQFMLSKHLHRHMNAKHNKKHACLNCHKNYYSDKEFKEHNCSAIPYENKQKFLCSICNKVFFCEKYLKRHIKIHSEKETKKTATFQRFICEICAQDFVTHKGLRLHSLIHQKSAFECDICSKKFYRKDVLNQHKTTHSINKKLKCEMCNKEFKNKQSLLTHTLLHSGYKTYHCELCPKSFLQYSALVSHKEKCHSNRCLLCKKNFESEELLNVHKNEHGMEFYECPLCNKYVKLRSSLRRHLKLFHHQSNIDVLMQQIKSKKVKLIEKDKTQYNNSVVGDNLDANSAEIFLKANSINQIEDKLIVSQETSNINELLNYSQSSSNLLLIKKKATQEHQNVKDDENISFNESYTDNLIIQKVTSNENEVCLSMPDLTERDQEITLGENAYMLEDGTIVEHKEQGKVYVYMLGQSNFS